MNPYWLVAIPTGIELLWAISFRMKRRRWQETRTVVRQMLNRYLPPGNKILPPAGEVEPVEVQLNWQQVVRVNPISVMGDFWWLIWFYVYHMPLVSILRLFGRIPQPFSGFTPRIIVMMVGTAVLYTGSMFAIARQLPAPVSEVPVPVSEPMPVSLAPISFVLPL